MTAPQNMRLAGMLMTGLDVSSGPQDARPAQVFQWTTTLPVPGAGTTEFVFTATGLSSNGTASATASVSVFVSA